MTLAGLHSKYRVLAIGALALVALPLAMSIVGLTVNTASVVGYVWGGFWAWRAGVAAEHRRAYDPDGTHPCSPKTASSS